MPHKDCNHLGTHQHTQTNIQIGCIGLKFQLKYSIKCLKFFDGPFFYNYLQLPFWLLFSLFLSKTIFLGCPYDFASIFWYRGEMYNVHIMYVYTPTEAFLSYSSESNLDPLFLGIVKQF